MGLNTNDRAKVEKQAENNGYRWNSDNSKMTNGSGGSVKFSETGGSVNINGSSYNNTSGATKSTKW